jgi:hypothetical protein
MVASSLLADVLRVLLPVQDVLDDRVDGDDPPVWCVRRGWEGFLLALDDGELRRCEEEGLGARAPWIAGAPAGLRALAEEVAAATRLPALPRGGEPLSVADRRLMSARKQEQIPALLAAVEAMARHARRIVDVGAGSGHLSRVAWMRFGKEVVGIDRDPRYPSGPRADGLRFVTVDVGREPLSFDAADLAVGLHACGALGDRLAMAAAAAGCDVALVSCCPQKIEGPVRAPLSRAGAGLSLRRETLGLGNLTAQPVGVEASLEAQLAAREARQALALLLRSRGAEVRPGEEMRGINRRRAGAGLAAIAAPALASRGLPPASAAEIRRHEEEARRRHACIRRLSLPRNMLARLLELYVVLDRAAALEERGAHVRVLTFCDRVVTPRNIALFAGRSPERLPA